jgi:predicted HicB family RNase H-like nuclease
LRKLDSYKKKYGDERGKKILTTLQKEAAHASVHARRMKKERKGEITKTTLRVPTELWKEVRTRAIAEGVSAEALVNAALADYLKKGGK